MIGLRGYLAAAGVLAFVALGWWIDARAYARGEADCRAAHAEATRKLNDEIRTRQREADRRAREYLDLSADLDALERKLADEAAADPAAGPCISPDGLHRLDAIR